LVFYFAEEGDDFLGRVADTREREYKSGF